MYASVTQLYLSKSAAVINRHFYNGETTRHQLSKWLPDNSTIFAAEATSISLVLKYYRHMGCQITREHMLVSDGYQAIVALGKWQSGPACKTDLWSWTVREITKSSSTFSATNISSSIVCLFKRHDTIQMKSNYTWIYYNHDNIAIWNHITIYIFVKFNLWYQI